MTTEFNCTESVNHPLKINDGDIPDFLSENGIFNYRLKKVLKRGKLRESSFLSNTELSQ